MNYSTNGTITELAKTVETSELLRYGTVDWLFREYKNSKAYLDKVAPRSRPDYERTMLVVADLLTKKGDRIGSLPFNRSRRVAADKIYEKIIHGPRASTTTRRESRRVVSQGLEGGAPALSRSL